MCTAVSYRCGSHYFGRNLDLEFSYNEQVCVTPRAYPFTFRMEHALSHHYALIGMAYVVDDYPLYYDATNEKGLSMAGLNFEGNADYKMPAEGAVNITPFELIPWVLGQYATVREAKNALKRLNLVNINFSDALPLSPLHWLLADRDESVVIECVREGLRVHENPVGVLTNNPPFELQLFRLNDYLGVTREPASNRFGGGVALQAYSRGMGGLGLPGDLSSGSRFVRAAFTRANALPATDESGCISQFFHILGSVRQVRGCAHLGEEKFEYTIYSSCCNTDEGIYYYTTYENSQICAVNLHHEALDGRMLACYPLIQSQQVHRQN